VPIDPATLSAKFYQQDGMHLNADGAVLFTSALAKDLPERVVTHETVASHLVQWIPAPLNASQYVAYREH
jgi:hypothetical protein